MGGCQFKPLARPKYIQERARIKIQVLIIHGALPLTLRMLLNLVGADVHLELEIGPYYYVVQVSLEHMTISCLSLPSAKIMGLD